MLEITVKDFSMTTVMDIMRLATPREKPFHSAAWRAWQEGKPGFPSPIVVRAQTRSTALQGQSGKAPMTLREVNELYPKTSPELEAQLEVYETWQAGVKQYSSRHIHAETQTQVRYKAWRQSKSIPEYLDFYEYWFLNEWFRALGNDKVQQLYPLNYKHIAPTNHSIGRKFKSKVGNTYRDWLLMECVSEDERTSKPLYYKAMCRACGHTIARFNYSRVAQPCGNCAKIAKAVAITAAPLPGRLVEPPSAFAPINLWLTPEGWFACIERPEGATARMVLQGLDSQHPIPVEHLEPEDLTEALPEPQKETPPPVVEESQTLTVKPNTLLNSFLDELDL
jgi:hypothetical protein